jgi:hypothetical protein
VYTNSVCTGVCTCVVRACSQCGFCVRCSHCTPFFVRVKTRECVFSFLSEPESSKSGQSCTSGVCLYQNGDQSKPIHFWSPPDNIAKHLPCCAIARTPPAHALTHTQHSFMFVVLTVLSLSLSLSLSRTLRSTYYTNQYIIYKDTLASNPLADSATYSEQSTRSPQANSTTYSQPSTRPPQAICVSSPLKHADPTAR